MNTKLTLRLDKDLIERAKRHARRQGKSLSVMVADYFRGLGDSPRPENLPPVVGRLKGALRGADIDRHKYRKHLEERYL